MMGEHVGGRPRKFQSVEEMQVAIDAYFEKCDARMVEVVVREGKNSHIEEINDPAPYTVTGLARELGIDRRTLLRYETEDRKDEFGDEFRPTIKAARERVQENLEFRLYDGHGYGPGNIFGLKNNYDWRDTHDHNVKGTMTVNFDKEDEGL